MKKFLHKLVFQLDKPFYIWALLAGPIWAQNITFFAIWVYITLLVFVVIIEVAARETVLEKVKRDKELGRSQELVEKTLDSKPNWLWILPSLAVSVAAASQAWFASASIYAVLILISFGSAASKYDDIKRIIDEKGKDE
ncbi:MAG: hypothetical protein GQ553_04485 [Nitrosomonadaceae bacterium]|nr:hypothetical protein [Nitrosomonadaceae bacterium]